MGLTAVGVAGLGLSVLGTGLSVAGSIQQGQAQKAAADYQAQVARNNSIVASQNAAAVRDQATAKAIDTARAGDQRLGAQRAAMAANGITLDSGSALDVQSATATNTALGESRDQYQGELAAYGYQAQGSNYGAQAGLDTLTGDNAATAGGINATSSLLSGASQISSKWASWLPPVRTDPMSGLSYAQATGGIG